MERLNIAIEQLDRIETQKMRVSGAVQHVYTTAPVASCGVPGNTKLNSLFPLYEDHYCSAETRAKLHREVDVVAAGAICTKASRKRLFVRCRRPGVTAG